MVVKVLSMLQVFAFIAPVLTEALGFFTCKHRIKAQIIL